MVAATFGCRFCTISKQTLQLARFAAGRIRRALTKIPKPPNDNGKLAMSHTFNGKSMPNNEDRHWRNELSCRVAYSCGSGRESSDSGRCAEQQQQPGCLQVAHCWYSFRESGGRRSQMIFHEISMPQRCPRSPLLGLWSASGDPLSKPPNRGPTLELLARGRPCASAQRPLDSTGFPL